MLRSPIRLPTTGIQCQTGLACSDRGTHSGGLYRDSRGTEPVDEFIQALPPKRAAKIDEFVEEYLNGQPPEVPPPAFPITSQPEGELRVLRVRFANTRYRILYQPSENLVVLFARAGEGHRASPSG